MPLKISGRGLRLTSGVILMAYVISHYSNHAFGLISLDALAAASQVFGIWHTMVGGYLILAALLLHMSLTLYSLWSRRTMELPRWQWAQLAFGLMIPGLLALHYVGTRGVRQMFPELQMGYDIELFLIWPGSFLQQSILLVIVWIHGCIGIHYWLRLRAWYRRIAPILLGFAVLLPTLSLLGVVGAGRMQRRLIEADPAAFEALKAAQNWPAFSEFGIVYLIESIIVWSFLGIVAAIVVARFLRYLIRERRNSVRVGYVGGGFVRAPKGSTILEVSRMASIPHASVCGGRGRCSTCRVRVVQGLEALPPAGEQEQKVLRRVGANDQVRLACQTRPEHPILVEPLMPADVGSSAAMRKLDPGQGREREIVVLFADIRGFTRMSEGRLPYDVVYILNRYFKSMGGAIENAGGRVDKFIGDGIMALFGLEVTGQEVSRQAMQAAHDMSVALDRLNNDLKGDLKRPLRIGIGLHVGNAIVGEMGYGGASGLTAIGDMVNVASRLEALTKDYGAELVVSELVIEQAGLTADFGRRETVAVRGRLEELAIRIVDRAQEISLPSFTDKLAVSFSGVLQSRH